jgi:hypothetical protein
MFTHPSLFAAGAMLALAITIEVSFPPETPSASAGDCVAQRWVDENLDQLPTTYEEFAGYPIRYRKMIYTKLPLDTRAAFWRVHLDAFMATHDLSLAQAELVQMARANISAYVQGNSPAQLDSIYTRAVGILGVELTKDAFLTLVPASSTDLLSEACSCSTVHDNCEGFYACGEDDDSCDAVACGIFHHDTCNGECLTHGG